MLHPFTRLGRFPIQLGDTARFPLGRLGSEEPPYNRTWVVVAYGGPARPECVRIRRRHDGLEKWLAELWWDAYANPFLKGGRQAAPPRPRDPRKPPHVPQPCCHKHPHDASERFYVTCRDGKRVGWLLGPYDTHQEALDNVPRGRRLADKADPGAPWYYYGTTGIHGAYEAGRKTVFGR